MLKKNFFPKSFASETEMNPWTVDRANDWYQKHGWLVGCNFIPSTAVNQLEMWQAETYDPETIDRELGWAESLGFNTLRVFLHDLVWSADQEGFFVRVDHFLGLAARHSMKTMLVFFDDCHRPDPEPGPQPLPVARVHNSGWKQSPGRKLVQQFYANTVPQVEKSRIAEYVRSVLTRFAGDDRILMWDLYNEPGAENNGDRTNVLLKEVWRWAREVGPSQPLTACLNGSVGNGNITVNAECSDVITFHCYDSALLENILVQERNNHSGRPVICTEYMARELGTTFQYSLPIFRKYRTGCYNWGLVAGKTQTHWNWRSIKNLESLKSQADFLTPGDPIPEPSLWFHDIFRTDGTPFDQREIDFIKAIMR